MSVDPDQVTESVRSLERELTLGGPSARLATVIAAADCVLAVDSVGILLLDEDGVLRAVAASGPAAHDLESTQEHLRVGPGVTALAGPEALRSDDLTHDYPELSSALRDGGSWAVVSAPILIDGDNVGNLNAIRTSPHHWSDAEVEAVASFAGVVAGMLRLSASAVAPDGGRSEQTAAPRPKHGAAHDPGISAGGRAG